MIVGIFSQSFICFRPSDEDTHEPEEVHETTRGRICMFSTRDAPGKPPVGCWSENISVGVRHYYQKTAKTGVLEKKIEIFPTPTVGDFVLDRCEGYPSPTTWRPSNVT
jgi:hypothetical protein